MSKIYCPNCGDPAQEAGPGKIYCSQCDTEFAVSQTKGAKAVKTGVLDDLSKRVETLEKIVRPAASPPPTDQADPDNPPDDEDEDEDEADLLPG